tara:strand:+ start:1297 stop:2304 length:1008 start_codon:yes stop_codon:yes gene_type:complete
MISNNVKILDCTLRDGSYPMNFQFTTRDTGKICTGLESAGFSLIEVGHGLGLGASSAEYGISFEKDEDYISSAVNSVKKSSIGVFFIPGIGKVKNIKKAAANGLNFIRIGLEPNKIKEAAPYIDNALSLGLDVYLNIMKTYANSPLDIQKQLEKLVEFNLKAVYVVDSSGCMIPNQVKKYVKELKKVKWNIGFHGHNNLNLANANCLSAIDAGAKYVDGSLGGIGRSAGNAQTEVLSWLFKKNKYSVDYDTFKLFNLINEFIIPLNVKIKNPDLLDILSGISSFHSSYLPLFKRVISTYDVDLFKLIYNVSKINCLNPNEKLIISVAKDMVRTYE